MFNLLIGLLGGYILHDAVQPTPVGKVLDKVSLPADLFTEVAKESDDAQVPM